MWREVLDELDLWHREGRIATFWWRDDDAVDETPQLRSLLQLAQRLDVPIALSVIPARFSPRLVRFVKRMPQIDILVHGYEHENHAPAGRSKCEFGGRRPLAVVDTELRAGLALNMKGFGGQALPVLVPPWNRIAPRFAARLAALGYTGLSTWKPRPPHDGAETLVRVNTHLDPVDWRRGRALKSERAVAAALLRKLRWRRARPDRALEPLGLLTHHLLWDPRMEHLVESVVATTRSHPAARWLAAKRIFKA